MTDICFLEILEIKRTKYKSIKIMFQQWKVKFNKSFEMAKLILTELKPFSLASYV